jgi:hypothetical protein
MIDTLYTKLKALLAGHGFMVYDIEPDNPSYPYVLITSPVTSDRDGSKDKRYTSGTIDLILKVATSRTRGSNTNLFSFTSAILAAIKPTEQSQLDLGASYDNAVLYLSNQFRTEEKDKTKRILIEKLTYYFEIETK